MEEKNAVVEKKLIMSIIFLNGQLILSREATEHILKLKSRLSIKSSHGE